MKVNHKFFAGVLLLAVAAGCNDGIDPISPVDPGVDAAAPVVKINYPAEGTLIRVKEDVTPIDINLEVTDDIEIASIAVALDGNEITRFSSFPDYRRALKEYRYSNLTNGQHTLTVTAKDLAGKTTTGTVNFEKIAPYVPVYSGEIFYMPFDGDYMELVSIKTAAKVGNPGFSDVAVAGGKSYRGETDGYLTFPTAGLLGNSFSAAFWYKVNATPDRSGILVIGPPDAANPSNPNNRRNGFRLFRENAGGKQRIKLNVGNGGSDNWYDGGANADIDPASTQWVHVAFTISNTKCVVYLNGQVVSQGSFAGVNWTGCDILSIASGAPRFTEWGHLSDRSLFDELRLFNKELTQQEILDIMN